MTRERRGRKALGCIAMCVAILSLLTFGICSIVIALNANRYLPNGYRIGKSSSHHCVIVKGAGHVVVDDNVYDWRVQTPFVWGYRRPATIDVNGRPVNDFFLLDTSTDTVKYYESRTLFEMALKQHGLDAATVDGLTD